MRRPMGSHWKPYSYGGDYLATQEDRCAPRCKVNIPASLRLSGAKSFHTMLHDLSLGGFSATSLNRMHVGSICWLTLPGLEFAAGRSGVVGTGRRRLRLCQTAQPDYP